MTLIGAGCREPSTAPTPPWEGSPRGLRLNQVSSFVRLHVRAPCSDADAIETSSATPAAPVPRRLQPPAARQSPRPVPRTATPRTESGRVGCDGPTPVRKQEQRPTPPAPEVELKVLCSCASDHVVLRAGAARLPHLRGYEGSGVNRAASRSFAVRRPDECRPMQPVRGGFGGCLHEAARLVVDPRVFASRAARTTGRSPANGPRAA